MGRNVRTNERVAVKSAASGSDREMAFQVLKHEANMLRSLRHLQTVPDLRWFGVVDGTGYLVMDLLGETLAPCRDANARRILSLFSCGIECLRGCHDSGVAHRDVKPANIVYNAAEKDALCLIDFGLAKRIRRGTSGKTGENMVGNPIHSSASVMEKNAPGFGDDLVSLCYTFIDIFCCALPWSRETVTADIVAMKMCPPGSWVPSRCPGSILRSLEYGATLQPDRPPDYSYLSKLIRSDEASLPT